MYVITFTSEEAKAVVERLRDLMFTDVGVLYPYLATDEAVVGFYYDLDEQVSIEEGD